MKKNFWGIMGCCIGFIALVAAFLSPYIAKAIDPPSKPLEESVVDLAIKIKDAAVAKVKGEEYVAESESKKPSAFIVPAVISAGMLGTGFGLLSLMRGERKEICSTAMTLGVAAAVVQWSIIFASVLLVFLLVAAVLNGLGIGFPSF